VTDNINFSRRHEKLSFTHHAEVASLSDEEQDFFLNEAERQHLSTRELREAIRRYNIQIQETQLPTGKYRVIYADPPWQYSNSMPSYVTTPANYYPLMSIDELCAMPVKELAEDNAVLFLWVTVPMMQEALEVIEAWGFEYKTNIIWDKIKHNMGHYFSVRHELLYICTRGSCLPDTPKLYDSVQTIERTEHSAKPELFREIIDTIYPYGKRIELFARQQIKNWETYGNQLSKRE
jgi:N6-adenosine-specific RNA methylase IME4